MAFEDVVEMAVGGLRGHLHRRIVDNEPTPAQIEMELVTGYGLHKLTIKVENLHNVTANKPGT